MSRTKAFPTVAAAVCLICAVFFWRISWNAALSLDPMAEIVFLRDASGLASYSQMTSREEKAPSPIPFALWGQSENQTVLAVGTGREANLAVVGIQGDSRLLFPGDATLAPQDGEGCLIDRHTALALTGDGNAKALQVEWQDRVYTVRGVITEPKGTMVIWGENSGISITHVALEGDADAFCLRQTLSPGLMVEGSVFRELAGFFRWLPIFTTGWILLWAVLHLRKCWNSYPVRSLLLGLVGCALLTVMTVRLLQLLPLQLVPNRWSDLEYWSLTLGQMAEKSRAWLVAAWLRPELYFLHMLLPSFWGMVSVICLLLVRRALAICHFHRYSSNHKQDSGYGI